MSHTCHRYAVLEVALEIAPVGELSVMQMLVQRLQDCDCSVRNKAVSVMKHLVPQVFFMVLVLGLSFSDLGSRV